MELVVVVAIVAVLVGVAAYQITRSRRRVSVERALYDLQGRVLHAQSLAAVAGSRLGVLRDPARPRLVYDGTCTADPANQLWIRFNGPQVELPALLRYDNATDQITVVCETFDLTAVTQTVGIFNAPAAPVVFGFSPSGRTVTPAGPAAPIYVEVGSPTDSKTFGFRVLPSGIVCAASTLGGPLCDEETGT